MLDPLFIKLTYNDETKTRLVRAKENLKLSYGGPSKRQTSGKLPIDKDFNSMNLTKPYRTENFLIRPRTCSLYCPFYFEWKVRTKNRIQFIRRILYSF